MSTRIPIGEVTATDITEDDPRPRRLSHRCDLCSNLPRDKTRKTGTTLKPAFSETLLPRSVMPYPFASCIRGLQTGRPLRASDPLLSAMPPGFYAGLSLYYLTPIARGLN